MKKKRLIGIGIALLLLIGVLVLADLFWLQPLLEQMRLETQKLEVTTYQVTDDEIPEVFSGFRIAQVSDLHNTEFGENNEQLLQLLRDSQPDIIVITGDLIDSRKPNLEIAVAFAGAAAKIAPCYYVNGNHEAATTLRPVLMERLADEGVMGMESTSLPLERNGQTITLMGLDDPSLHWRYPSDGAEAVAELLLTEMLQNAEGYKVLLAHHPEYFEIYRKLSIDLVLSGHTHGGQLRSKKYGALIAPGQGFFPKYDAGIYQQDNTTMIISRGLGNSRIQLRLNNPPELVLIDLNQGE